MFGEQVPIIEFIPFFFTQSSIPVVCLKLDMTVFVACLFYIFDADGVFSSRPPPPTLVFCPATFIQISALVPLLCHLSGQPASDWDECLQLARASLAVLDLGTYHTTL